MRIFKTDLIKVSISLILAMGALMLFAPNRALAQIGPRNIIIMISDGCGYDHIDAASIYQHGRTGAQVYQQFLIQYGMSTYMSGGRYDPDRAWTQFSYVQSGATDSAASSRDHFRAPSMTLKRVPDMVLMDTSLFSGPMILKLVVIVLSEPAELATGQAALST